MAQSNVYADRGQLAKIHIAKKDLCLDEETYRGMLSGYGVSSSNMLRWMEADELINRLKQAGWQPKPAKVKRAKIVINVPASRPEHLANIKQLKMLAAMWVDKSDEKTERSFDKFICRITKVNHYAWLKKRDVNKMVKAIENL